MFFNLSKLLKFELLISFLIMFVEMGFFLLIGWVLINFLVVFFIVCIIGLLVGDGIVVIVCVYWIV